MSQIQDLPPGPEIYDEVKYYYFSKDGNQVTEKDDWFVMKRVFIQDGQDIQRETYFVDDEEDLGEGIEQMFGPPASQAFSDIGNNPHLETDQHDYKQVQGKSADKIILDEHEKLGKPFNEKSDTGDDHSRTGPEGNQPRDNYDKIHYQSQAGTKVHIATPYYDGKEIHDVSGIIPELQEDIKITLEDPKGDEGMPKIELLIEEPKPLEKEVELKDTPGRKDPGTHINTIKADAIDLNLPISDVWKGDEIVLAEAPAANVDFIKKIFPQLAQAGILSMSLPDLIELLKNQNFEQMNLFKGKIEAMPKLNPVKHLIFQYNSGKTPCPICKPLDGMEFVDDDPKRPIIPSEGLGKDVLNTHPNCKCTWKEFLKLVPADITPKSEPPQSRAAASSLRDREDITQEYLRPLQEGLNIFKHKRPGEFDWIDESEIENMKKYSVEHGHGRFILAVVAGDTITDHRVEGEKVKRHWPRNELIQTIRTGKGKLTDINHHWPKVDPNSGGVYDANWNFTTDKGEMILWETDQQILQAIRDDIITGASINTGKPRKMEENCETGECVAEPEGVILGEDNQVALAFIITRPEGWNYNGQHIPAMPAGMKFTRLYIVE